MESFTNIVQGAKSLRPGPRIKTNAAVFPRKHSNKMTPGNILLYYIQCCAQPSLEELPPAVDGSEYRDPQTDNVQIVRDL